MKKLLLMFVLLSGIIYAQADSVTIEIISQSFGSGTNAADQNGDYLYTHSGQTVRIFQIEPDFELIELANIRLDCSIKRIEYNNNHLYVTSPSGSIAVIDITDPYSPVVEDICSNCTSEDLVIDFDICNDRLLLNYYVPYLTGVQSVRSFNIETPESLVQLSPALTTTGSPRSIMYRAALNDNYLFLLNREYTETCGSLYPYTISIYDIHSGAEMDVILNDCINMGYAIDVDDNYLYLIYNYSLSIYDISDPYSTFYVTSCPLDDVVIDDYDYDHISNIDLIVESNTVIIRDSEKVLVYEISDSLEMTRINSLCREGFDYQISASDTLLFIHHNNNDMEVVNLSSSPDVSDTIYFSEDSDYYYQLIQKDDYLICLENEEIEIIDISDPFAPIEISTYPIEANSEMCLKDDFLYVPTIENGVEILDISDVHSITQIATIDTNVINLYVDNNSLYYSTGTESYEQMDMRVFNIDDPYSPVYLREYERLRETTNFVVKNNLILFVHSDSYISIYQITDDPFLTSLYVQPDISRHSKIKTYDDFVYISDYGTLHMYNMSGRTDSYYINSVSGEHSTCTFAQENGIAFFSTPDLLIKDVSNPFDFENIANFDMACNPMGDIVIDENYLYTIGTDGGLLIYEISGLPEPGNTCPITPGWNLVSYPYTDTLDIASAIPEAEEPIFRFNSETRDYEATTELSSNYGFWVRSNNYANYRIDYTHYPAASLTLELAPGWNLIGGTFTDVPGSIFESYPEILSPLFYYNRYERAYEESDTLKNHIGYWILSSDSVEVSIP